MKIAGEGIPSPSKAEMMTAKHGTCVMPLCTFLTKYACTVSYWPQTILESFTRNFTVWFEGEIRDELESSIQAPDSSIWGLLTHMTLNGGVFLSPPCLES